MDLWAEFRILDLGQRLGRYITHYRNAYFTPDKRNGEVIFSYKPLPGAEEAILFEISISMLCGCITYGNTLGEKGSNGIGDQAKDNRSGIRNFSYRYQGSIGGNSYSFDIKSDGDKYKVSYDAMQYSDYGILEKELDDSFLE